uniref:Uncharacterized protein n=1 Tax=Anguilla anguilla TaxID=7936 RepID=A0A0E9UXA2_ANGAN
MMSYTSAPQCLSCRGRSQVES